MAWKMKLFVEAEYTSDRSKIMFQLTADGRVDFRELVMICLHLPHLHRAAPDRRADESKEMIGGLGTCGQPCCSRF